MSTVDGIWSVVIKSPMGDQKANLTVKSDGDTFTGNLTGGMGSSDITDGKISGNTLTWTAGITVPMPMSLSCEATIDGDSITGSVKAGAFGSFPLTGARG